MIDRLSTYARTWTYLFPVLGLFLIKFSDLENKGRWYIGNLVVSAAMFLTIFYDSGNL